MGVEERVGCLRSRKSRTESIEDAMLEVSTAKGMVRISFEGSSSELYRLLEANMRVAYEGSAWGWDGPAKQEELDENDARFAVARFQDDLVAFAHFRFETDDDDDPTRVVLYVRELQTQKEWRGHGIGATLIHICDVIANDLHLDALMVTVFKQNLGARRLYDRLGFVLDPNDPSYFNDDVDYSILSRRPGPLPKQRRGKKRSTSSSPSSSSPRRKTQPLIEGTHSR